jgi:KamA family protein
LLVSQECGIHCRFCFRRHFPKTDILKTVVRLQCTHIEEIILSGGDPLLLDDDTLDSLFQSILRFKHIRRIRIHSRLPIVLPSRLTPKLAEILTLPIPVYLVLHVNHPNELSDDFIGRRELLSKPVVMAQTVLLRNINDNAETLYRLFRRLIDVRILPYYLHQLDRVEGSAHFEVPPEKGLELLAELRERLPGYAVPVYVREVGGKTCKEVIL